jgi:hypothetical protein
MLQKHLSAVGLGIALVQFLLAGIVGSPTAHAQQIPPAEDIAAQVRTQGHRCEGDPSALKLTKQSWPDEPLWILTCTNATYRVRLVPDMAAQIERVQ